MDHLNEQILESSLWNSLSLVLEELDLRLFPPSCNSPEYTGQALYAESSGLPAKFLTSDSRMNCGVLPLLSSHVKTACTDSFQMGMLLDYGSA